MPITPNHFNVNPGALFWSEIPDPASIAGNQSLIMQRKKIEIHDQLKLQTVLADNEFRFKSEAIEETYDIYHREVDLLSFHLVRNYRLPPNVNPDGSRTPLPTLPSFDALEKQDPAGKWQLWAKAYVLDDQSPDKIKAARDALTKVRDDFGSTINFLTIDRKYHDTQITVPRQPATQTLGRTQPLNRGLN